MSTPAGRPGAAPLKLDDEARTVQLPLLQHAADVGWTPLPRAEALRKRGGEAGLFFYDELRDALLRLNPGLVTADNVDAVIARMEGVRPTMEGNRELLEWLRGQRSVHDEAERRQRNVTLIDYGDLTRNRFHVTAEWTTHVPGRKANRADVMFVINGVPVAIVENKNPDRRDALTRAVTQLQRYQAETPELVLAPQVFNVTHLLEYHYGVTWNYGRKNVHAWKQQPSERLREAVQTFFDRACFLELLREWVLFYVKDDELQKSILRQHQTRAVHRVVARCADPAKRRGLVWHTQGSGKTFTLITAARLILQDAARFAGATVVLVVDRNELEGQLAGWVERMLGELRGEQIAVERADSKAELQALLDRDFRGLVISMLHKFDGLRADSCARDNVFVFIDEAHRSVGGDLGTYLMAALPNATLVGFTGTPVDRTAHGQGTFKVFGRDDPDGYTDKYTIRESIADGTTLKLRHSLAPGELLLDEGLLEREFYTLTDAEGVSDIDELNRVLDKAVQLRTALKADERVAEVARFVAEHFQQQVAPLGYKAFLVAVDREACALYTRALRALLPPDWVEPIYSSNPADVVDRPLAAEYQVEGGRETELRKLFAKPDQNPRLFVVTDKLLTGFDAAVLYCLYLDKPMRDHVLLQAVARVNRPYEDARGQKKPCGLVVDFVGVLKELNKALRFDSREVSGVIEDLDALLARFRALMDGDAQPYLRAMAGDVEDAGRDVVLERLLYETFLNKEARRAFAELFKDVESLYEVLSPSPELHPYVTPYNRLAKLYVMLRNAYGPAEFYYGDLARKTEHMVRESGTLADAYRITRTVEFDEAALAALQAQPVPEGQKVVNLVRAIDRGAELEGERQPELVGIAARAHAVLDALEERQASTAEALQQIRAMLAEQAEAEQLRRETGLDEKTFGVFWLLRKDYPGSALALAREIGAVRARYPNATSNAEEMRQLKAETYKVLMRVVTGRPMITLAERVLGLVRDA